MPTSVLAEAIKRNGGIDTQYREAELVSVNEEERTATFSFSSEYEVGRWYGVEILDHSEGSVRMDRINAGGAFLMDHNHWDQRGVVVEANIEGKRGMCTVKLSRSERGEELWQDIKDRIRTQVSVGYIIHEIVLERKEGDTEFYRVTDWEPTEISSVSVAADPSVGVGRSQENPTYRPVNIKGVSAMDQNELEQDLESGTRDAGTPPVAKPTEQRSAAPARPAAPAAEPVNHAREIAKMGEQYGNTDLAMRAISEGKTQDEFKDMLLADHSERMTSGNQTTMHDLGMSDTDLKRYSLMNVVRALASGQHEKYASYELAVSNEMAERMNKEPQGILVPYEVMGAGVRTQLVGTAAKGGNLVATELHSEMFIEALRQESMMGRMGARMMSGLVGNVDIPKQAGSATFYWINEDEDVTDSDLDFGLVSLTPRTVAGSVPISRRLMLQTSGEVEALVRNDLIAGLADALDDDILATILATAGIGAVTIGGTAGAPTPTWANLVELETDVEEANAGGDGMGYVMRPSMKGVLKTTEKFSGTGQVLWPEGGNVNGYPAGATTQMAAGQILFGRYSQAMMGLWGAVDLVVDKSTKAASGGTVLRIFQDADSVVRHAGAFSLGATA